MIWKVKALWISISRGSNEPFCTSSMSRRVNSDECSLKWGNASNWKEESLGKAGLTKSMEKHWLDMESNCVLSHSGGDKEEAH